MLSNEQIVQQFIDDLKSLRDKKGNMEVDDISQLLNNVATSFFKNEQQIYNEIRSIAESIDKAHREIGNIKNKEVPNDRIQGANLELEEVIKATENATNIILDSAEKIQGVTSRTSSEISQILTENITKIFEACNFQDITGQRIRKVLRLLIEIEAAIKSLLETMKSSGSEAAKKSPVISKSDPKSLLNGPQLENEAPKQDDIDKLFSSLK